MPDLVRRVGDDRWDGHGTDPSKDAALAALKALGAAEDVTEALTVRRVPIGATRAPLGVRAPERAAGSAMTTVLSGLLRDKDGSGFAPRRHAA